MTVTRISVDTAQPYVVSVGKDLLTSMVESLPEQASRVLIVHAAVMRDRAATLRAAIEGTGRLAVLAEVPDAEAGKTVQVAAFCWEVLGKSEFTRTDVVVGLGGGAVTDLAGFVAATWLRGVPVVHLPTTVLAMVDAAVGGKTGINTPEGKNLVGSFHEPLSVWCDVDTLSTLPANELVAGMAEVVKAGFIADTSILDTCEAHAQAFAATVSGGRATAGTDALADWSDGTWDALTDVMARAIAVKAAVVSADLKESHLREILNYGHTFGHAIEYTERYQWRHGAAVSVGMIYAAELARLVGKLSQADVDRHRDLLDALGLPTSYVPGRWDALHTAMRRDKKTRADMLRFVILHGIGNPQRLEGPDPALLTAAYDAVSS